MLLCYTATEYACAAWERSHHARHLDPILNNIYHKITVCLGFILLSKVYCLAGIAPPHIRRRIAARDEKLKEEQDPRHPMYNYIPASSRLKSRNSFLDTISPLQGDARTERVRMWKSDHLDDSFPYQPAEELLLAHDAEWIH